MKKMFYAGLAGLFVYEVLKVYFIMPMPGSQRMNTLEAAYFLHQARWWIRGACLLAILAGAREAFAVRGRSKGLPILLTLVVAAVAGLFNFKMTADHMFRQPRTLVLLPRAENKVEETSVVVAVEHNGDARAYPIRYLVYHHQVQDTIGGKAFIVTYCSVCRTGRVFEPLVNGQPEQFRLVGMDHFNAMFEDARTGSWWRQANGEAVVGPLKGAMLPAVEYEQMTLAKWFEAHPTGKVMQPDPDYLESYDKTGGYERGESKGELTRTDPGSWQDKSWVIGVQVGQVTKAYDWNQLKAKRVINDTVAGQPVVIVLAVDGTSWAVYERPGGDFSVHADTLSAEGKIYDFFGRGATPADILKPVPAHQEFWHSWRTFHPDTLRGE